MECIDVVAHMGFNLGNAMKYVWRAGLKDPTKKREDLEKAIWYVKRERDFPASSVSFRRTPPEVTALMLEAVRAEKDTQRADAMLLIFYADGSRTCATQCDTVLYHLEKMRDAA